MDICTEQRVWIKFYAKLGKSATKTLDMMRQAFPDNALGQACVGIGYGVCREVGVRTWTCVASQQNLCQEFSSQVKSQECIHVCSEYGELERSDRSFLSRIITGDESYSATATIRKRSNSLHSGQVLNHRCRKRGDRCACATKTMLIIFSTFVELSITSSFLPWYSAKTERNNSTVTTWFVEESYLALASR